MSWCEDMIWWGPAGIGATYTIERYAEQHSGPFRKAFRERTFNGHICTIAEGHFGGFFGWPNLTLTNHGGFMGMPATGKPGDMRVIDMYRRQGDKLAENWIFIDLLHFWNMQGVDILDRTAQGASDVSETGDMARFACDLRYEDLPEELLALLRRSFLDTIGVAAIGATTEMARCARRGSAGRCSGRDRRGTARVLMDGTRAQPSRRGDGRGIHSGCR